MAGHWPIRWIILLTLPTVITSATCQPAVNRSRHDIDIALPVSHNSHWLLSPLSHYYINISLAISAHWLAITRYADGHWLHITGCCQLLLPSQPHIEAFSFLSSQSASFDTHIISLPIFFITTQPLYIYYIDVIVFITVLMSHYFHIAH